MVVAREMEWPGIVAGIDDCTTREMRWGGPNCRCHPWTQSCGQYMVVAQELEWPGIVVGIDSCVIRVIRWGGAVCRCHPWKEFCGR